MPQLGIEAMCGGIMYRPYRPKYLLRSFRRIAEVYDTIVVLGVWDHDIGITGRDPLQHTTSVFWLGPACGKHLRAGVG